jgi:hypothetical protein
MSRLVIVGGDFSNDTLAINNVQVFMLNGDHILSPVIETPPHGYRSCVAFITNDKFVCCGTTGVDISTDGGINWQLISNESYNVCEKAKKGNAIFLAGKDGTISKLVFNP